MSVHNDVSSDTSMYAQQMTANEWNRRYVSAGWTFLSLKRLIKILLFQFGTKAAIKISCRNLF